MKMKKINTNENGCSLHKLCVCGICVVETKSILVCQNTEDCAKIRRTFTKSYYNKIIKERWYNFSAEKKTHCIPSS